MSSLVELLHSIMEDIILDEEHIAFAVDGVIYKSDLKEIEKALKTIDFIEYAMEHSGQASFELPNGKKYTGCDMGDVSDFMDIIEQTIEEEEQ